MVCGLVAKQHIYRQIDQQLFGNHVICGWLPGTFLNQSSDTKINVKIGQNLKIKSTVKGLMIFFSGGGRVCS